MTMHPFSLEPAIGTVLRIGTAIASAALAAGIALSYLPAMGVLSHALLVGGVFVLLLTPVARVVVSLIDFVLNRDWLFVSLNTIVLFLLGSAFVAAFI
jgi:uncharacterized membrane protein